MFAQNIFSGEPVQWVGRPNSYSTDPYNADYRTTTYRKIATTDADPTDGRGQWSTTINVQTTGGDIAPDNMPGGAGAGWLLISGPSGNRFQNKWNFTGVGQGAVNSINDVTYESGGEDMGLDMSTEGYYTFNMRDAGYTNSEFYVGYTASAPVTVSRTSETLNTVTNGTVINITTSAAPSAGENIYVRYVLNANDFTGSTTVVQATGTGTSWSAEIPSQDCGTGVFYYVYSSTRSSSDIDGDSESNRSLAALRYDDNAGANYSYTVSTANILASAGSNGTINPPGLGSVNCGDDATYIITPGQCYHIVDVLVDGVSQGPIGTYTFTGVTGSHTISASFAINSFTTTLSTSGSGSIVTPASPTDPGPDPLDPCGADRTFTFVPDACFSIADVVVDGVSVGAVTSYTLTNITTDHTISASFVETPYTIVVTQVANGNISPGSGTVNCGDNATYTITADPCYQISDVTVDGISQGPVASYTFTNVAADHDITASFSVTTYTITASAGTNGSVTPAGASVVNCGSNNVYTITPDVCYHVLDVLVDGASVGAVTSYAFLNTTANHTISATFELNTSLAAPVVAGPVNVCSYVGTANTATYTASSQGAASYNWTLPPNVVLQSSTANSITVTFNTAFTAQANHQIRVRAISPCGNSTQTIYYLAVQTPSTPSAISGNINVCAILGTTDTYTYTIHPAQGADSYVWTALPGATVITHPNGAGVNDTIITVSFNTSFTTSAITVQAINNCGASGVRSLTITRTAPSTPSPISGSTNVCANIAPNGIAATYSVTNSQPGAVYNWTVPAGSTGLTGQGTSTISFIFPAGFTSGTISVVTANGCGISGTRTLSVTRLLPSNPGLITALETTGCPNRIVHYSIPAMPANATAIAWVVPTAQGAVLLNGQGTTAIDVSYPGGPLTGVTVTATATSNCGNSAVRTINVVLTDCGSGPPPPPGPRTARGQAATTSIAAENMQVNVYPNPTVNDFKLQVSTAGKEKINVRITDMQGRQLKQLSVTPNQTTNIGADLNAGAYLMEVRQGTSVKTVKVIKF